MLVGNIFGMNSRRRNGLSNDVKATYNTFITSMTKLVMRFLLQLYLQDIIWKSVGWYLLKAVETIEKLFRHSQDLPSNTYVIHTEYIRNTYVIHT